MMEVSRPMLVNEGDERLKCNVCSRLMIEPQSADCGHRGCRSCYERLKSMDGAFCPGGEEECLRKPFSQSKITPDYAFQRDLMTVEVFCANKNAGCNERMEYKDHMTHLVVCELRTACRFGCGETFERGQFAIHEDTCGKKPVSCDLCQTQVLLGELPMHQMDVCPKSFVPCSFDGCHTLVLRHELGTHVASCHNRCRFHSMGCKEQGSAEHVANHEQVNAEQQYRLITEYIEKLKMREEAATLASAGKRYQQASDCLDFRAEELRSIHDALLRNGYIAQRQLDRWQEASDVEQDLAALFELHANVQSLAERILIVETEPNECPVRVTYEAMLYEFPSRLFALDERLKRLETTNENGHIIVKVKDRTITMIDSQSFYTHREGYKLRLRMYPRGHGPGDGTHVSVYLEVLVGDNDQLLEWPFKPRVTLRLRLGPGHPSVEKVVEVVDGIDRPHAGWPPPTIGCPLFALRQSVEDPSLYDAEHDCYFVEVMVDTVGVGI